MPLDNSFTTLPQEVVPHIPYHLFLTPGDVIGKSWETWLWCHTIPARGLVESAQWPLVAVWSWQGDSEKYLQLNTTSHWEYHFAWSMVGNIPDRWMGNKGRQRMQTILALVQLTFLDEVFPTEGVCNMMDGWRVGHINQVGHLSGAPINLLVKPRSWSSGCVWIWATELRWSVTHMVTISGFVKVVPCQLTVLLACHLM